jgi:PhnB protein
MDPILTPRLAPYLLSTDCAALARFIEQGIGGTRGFQMVDSDGKFVHLEMKVADSVVMMADAPAGRPAFPAMLHLYVSDVDAAHRRALEAGATNLREPTEASDGRRGGVRDSWGNEWWFTRPR